MTHKRAIELLIQSQVFCPAVVPNMAEMGGYLVFSATKVLGHGSTIALAMEDAQRRGHLPARKWFPQFRGDGKNVIRFYTDLQTTESIIAVASSRTYADRIANALNQYLPNERGI